MQISQHPGRSETALTYTHVHTLKVKPKEQAFTCLLVQLKFFPVYLDVCFSHQHTEALLYGFQSIAETIDVNYSDVIPGLIGLIPRISINNVQLADTVMFTIG